MKSWINCVYFKIAKPIPSNFTSFHYLPHSGKKSLLSALAGMVFCLVQISLMQFASADSVDDALLTALSNRDNIPALTELENMAGGKRVLIEKLLNYRTLESPPFVAIRSEKLLLNYVDDTDVKAVLLKDLSSPELLGLARIITLHLDDISDSATRQEFARQALSRAKADTEFAPYAKALRSSNDEQVRKMAESLVAD